VLVPFIGNLLLEKVASLDSVILPTCISDTPEFIITYNAVNSIIKEYTSTDLGLSLHFLLVGAFTLAKQP
jgi:hypothetical protein